jgi:hypothetical protein
LLEELEARTEAARPGFRAMNFLVTYPISQESNILQMGKRELCQYLHE